MKHFDRRSILKAGLGGFAVVAAAPLFAAQAPARLTSKTLAGKIAVIDGAPGNVIALNASDGILLVDSGAANMAAAVKAALGGKVKTLFNTHYHADQTGGNELFANDGASIHAHVITKQWLSSDYYVPSADRWVKAPPVAARPTVTFRDKGTMTAGDEHIEYGYLLEAHTRGDIYVYFRDTNVLAVGDVASPLRDPSHDWYAGGWLGGRVDAMDDLLKLANDNTMIVPAYGAVMTKAQLQAERDMMAKLYDRTSTMTDHGQSAKDMLDAGVMNEVNRKFDDPYRFLYDVAKGLWAHYTNFGGNIV
ncbi:MAG TPA: MBL fold metallo-hydrolase [Candidatus Acidoferrum sp.]|nr:MBL fold metallo-hydrolase [Candidatus Acidoferrum sp.]